MLEIKNIEVVGLERSLKASGNAMTLDEINTKEYLVREHDVSRGKSLGQAKQGSGHDHYLAGIDVYMDIKYPLYWSPEAQRYHWFEIITSQSTMHRLMTAGRDSTFFRMFNKYVDLDSIAKVHDYIQKYNFLCEFIISEEDTLYYHPDDEHRYTYDVLEEEKYYYFMKARSNLPSGYEMWMTVKTNYLQLKTMYLQRKNHKLKEDWSAFITMCEELPMFLELTQRGK